jgi:transposase InsO family protein
MTLALNSKNKLGFVNRSIEAPSEKADPEGYATWSRCNDMVHSWIVNTLNPEIADSVIYYPTAHEVWEDLHERFSQSNAPRIFEIQRDIVYLRQEQLSVSAYYTKLKGLWDELASYSDTTHGAQADQQKLMQFLMGLNETYSAIRGQILLMNPLPSIRQAYSSVSQEEKQRLLSVTQTATELGGSAAMAVRHNNRGKPKSFSGPDRPYQFLANRSSQSQDVRPQGERRFDQDRHRFGSGRGRPQCTHCDEMGHWVQKCFKLHGYPSGHPKTRMHSSSISNHHKGFSAANQVSEVSHNDEVRPTVSLSETQLKQLLSLLNNHTEDSSSSKANAVTKPGLSKLNSHNWIIDSGATDHITSSSKLLYKNENCSLPPVLLPSGDKANIIAKGSLPLNSVYYLHDVLSVPTFQVDLMSVSRLTRSLNCSVTFSPYWCILQDLATRRTIGLGKQRNGLYYLVALATEKSLTNPSSSTNRPACNLTISSTDLWHSRLGHVSPSRLSFIAKNFLNFSVESKNACHTCPLAKQSRLPFGTSTISSTKPFDIIHCDIWGRYRHSSISGANYFLTIVDDYTRFTWIFLMRHKTEAQPILKHLFSYVFTQLESRIKTFRSDNGGEFTSLRSFFQDNGVIFQHSCVYTPQQNGVVERKHRHILQVARALKFHAQLPSQFWGECALTAVHIINRLPSPVISFKTPFELLYSKPPSYSHLRVFGCLAYATNVHTSHKFDRRALPSIFIGYPLGQKAYKLFDISTKKFFTSRDVKFHENFFPYASVKQTSPAPLFDHNSGPIPLLTHDPFDSFFNSIPNKPPPPPITQTDPTSPLVPQVASGPPSTASIESAPSDPSSPALADPPTLSTHSLPSPEPTHLPPEPAAPTPEPPRRSNRQTVPPIKLNDYVCSTVFSDQSTSLVPVPTKGTRYPLSNFVSYHRYKPAYHSFVAQIGTVT